MVSPPKSIIRLRPLIDCSLEDQLKELDIRNDPDVRKWMYTDHIIQISEHLQWIRALKNDEMQIVFIVFNSSYVPIGLVNINQIDRRFKRADWAFYLSPSVSGKGIGSAIEYAVIEFVFNVLGLQKLNCEVIAGNDSVVSLHHKFCFCNEGFRRDHVIKNDEAFGAILLGLSRNHWELFKPERPHGYQVDIEFVEKVIEAAVIDQIESIRALNNLNWMNILRLAMEKAPAASKLLLSEIQDADAEINELSKKLIL